ncbi:MAG: carbohydrate ABC transporter permease, partial [Sarcina sp.]
FVLYPTLEMARVSFTDWDGVSSAQNYIGIENYKNIFLNSPDAWKSFMNSLIYVIIGLLFIPLEIIFATFLNKKLRGTNFFKSAIFMPYIINGVAIAYAFSFFFSPENGAFNGILQVLGLGHLTKNWLSDPAVVNFTLASVFMWRNFGFFTILFLTGLQSIPEETLEAADIDGANSLQKLFYVVVPGLRRIIDIVIFMSITWGLQVFDIPFVMTSGGPGYASSTFSVFTMKTAFNFNGFGMAAAMGVVMIFVVAIIVLLQQFVMRRGVE